MMKLVGMTVSFLAFAWSFYRWYEAGEKDAAIRHTALKHRTA
jgi:hypothetical protein